MEPVRRRPPREPILTAVAGLPRTPPARRAFGHTAERTQIVDAEASAIREAARRVLDGETLSSVFKDWNARGLTTVNGGPWRVNSLSTLLVHRRLAAPPRILDETTHERLVALHASRSKGPRRATRRYLLTGLLRCWRCGGSMRGMPRMHGADLYVCPGPPHGGCSGTAITADHAEEAVGAMVLSRLESPPLLPAPSHTRDTVHALAAHRRRLEELGDMWASGHISKDEWLSLKRKVGERARAAEAEVARLGRLETLQAMAGTGATLRMQWPAMTIDERRRVVHAALDHIVVLAAEPPRQVFRPERLQPSWME